MKYLFSITVILSFLYADHHKSLDGGEINNIQQKIKNFEKTQKRIHDNIYRIDKALLKFNHFALSYTERVTDIIKEGAHCLIDKKKYLRSKKDFGVDDKRTIMYRNFMLECENMKTFRLSSLNKLNKKFDTLKTKVDDMAKLKQIHIERAKRIKKYIDALKKDMEFIVKNEN